MPHSLYCITIAVLSLSIKVVVVVGEEESLDT